MFSDLVNSGDAKERNSIFTNVEKISYKLQETGLVAKAKQDTAEAVNNLLDFWREKRGVLATRSNEKHRQSLNKVVTAEILA